jgi:hypothetical protein
MRNLCCLEKISILPFKISTGIVPQSLFKNLKILDLENTLVVEIQKGYLIVLSVIVYVLRQNCRAAGWRWDTKITILVTYLV